MKQRLLVAAIGVPLLIVVLVILPPAATAILTAAIAGAAAYELLHTAARQPGRLYGMTILTAAALVLFLAQYSSTQQSWLLRAGAAYAFLYLMYLFLTAVATHGKDNALPCAAAQPFPDLCSDAVRCGLYRRQLLHAGRDGLRP